MTEQKRILIVEDDEGILEVAKEVLIEMAGYEVETAGNGLEALDILRLGNFTPNLILLDLMMPKMDGLEFCEVQRRDPKMAAIPVLIMSADGHLAAKIEQMPGAKWIKKPVNVETLIAKIEEILNSVDRAKQQQTGRT